MAASFVQSQYSAVIATASITTTLGSTPAPGNLLIAVLTSNAAVSTPVPPWGAAPDVTSPGAPVLVYSKVAGASEPKAVTFSNATARNLGLTVMEFAPDVGKAWIGLDQSATASGTAVVSLAVGPTGAQANADDVAVGGIATSAATNTATPTLSNGYTVVGGLSGIARGFAGYKVLSSTGAESTTGAWTTSSNAGGAIATYKQAITRATRSGTATLVLTASSTSREVEKSAAPAGVTVTATAKGVPVIRTTGAASLTLMAAAASVQADKRAVTAGLTLTATATYTEVHTRTGTGTLKIDAAGTGIPDGGIHTRASTAAIVLNGTATGSVGPTIRTATAGIVLQGTAVARVILTRTGLAALELEGTGTATPPGGIYTRAVVASITLGADGPGITVHPRTGEASVAINQDTVVRSYVVERRTGAASLALIPTAVGVAVERRTGPGTIVLGARGRSIRDVTVLSITDRQRRVTITSVPRLVRIEPRP